VLISGLNRATEEGRSFTVVNPSPAAQRILTVTGLDEILTQRGRRDEEPHLRHRRSEARFRVP
jgi:anti-anti-sigma regulatory factor